VTPTTPAGERANPVEAPRPGTWTRLHPATPLLRGGISVLVVLGILFNQVRDDLVGVVTGGGPGDSARAWGWLQNPVHALWVAGSATVVILVLLGWMWLAWRLSAYRTGADTVEVRGGIVFRTHRSTRYDRIQRVDLDRPFLGRIFGLARVVVGTAHASGGLTIAYLRLDAAAALQAHLLGLARLAREAPAPWQEGPAGAPQGTAVPVAEDRGENLLHQPNGRLLLGMLLSPMGLLSLAILAVGAVALALGRPALGGICLAWGLPFLWGLGSRFFAHGSLELDILRDREPARPSAMGGAPAPDGLLTGGDSLRLRRGVLSRMSTTVPAGRIHALELCQPLLWRPLGWWRLRANVAGSSDGDTARAASSTLLAVGTAAEASRVVSALIPGVVDAADPSDAAGSGYSRSPRRVLLLGVVSPRRNGCRILPETEDGRAFGDGSSTLLLRRGTLWRSLSLIPALRVQSVSLSSGPLSRSMGVATLRVQTVPGTARTWLRGMAQPGASRLAHDWEQQALASLAATAVLRDRPKPPADSRR
jgi:putative membrane protein